jgi:hypothetical protein
MTVGVIACDALSGAGTSRPARDGRVSEGAGRVEDRQGSRHQPVARLVVTLGVLRLVELAVVNRNRNLSHF